MFNLIRDSYRYTSFRNPGSLGGFRGVYDTFQQAEAAAPRGSRIGYDHEDIADSFQADLDLHLESSDYALLFHLQRISLEGVTVLDFGGNIGVHFLRFKNYLDLERVKWVVLDLPQIAKAGRRACASFPAVTFVNEVAELSESRLDIVLSSGSIQYVESPSQLLQQLAGKGLRPRHLLFSGVPLYEGRRFVTLQNGGLVYYPQYVFNRHEFIADVEAHGYQLVDVWEDDTSACTIPFHGEKSVPAYAGAYFSLKNMLR